MRLLCLLGLAFGSEPPFSYEEQARWHAPGGRLGAPRPARDLGGLSGWLAPAPLGLPPEQARAELEACAAGEVEACVASAVAAERAWAWAAVQHARGQGERAPWRLEHAGAMREAACALGDERSCHLRSTRYAWAFGDLARAPDVCAYDDELSLVSWGWIGGGKLNGLPLPEPAYGSLLHGAVGDQLALIWSSPGLPLSVVLMGPRDERRLRLPAPPEGASLTVQDGVVWAWAAGGPQILALQPGARWKDPAPAPSLPRSPLWPGARAATSPDGALEGWLQGSALRVVDQEGRLVRVHGPLRSQILHHAGSYPLPVEISSGAVASGGCIWWLDGFGQVERALPRLELPKVPRDVIVSGVVARGGLPVEGATVIVRSSDGSEHPAPLDAQGRFQTERLRRARWMDVIAAAPGLYLRQRLAQPAGPVEVAWPEGPRHARVEALQLLDCEDRAVAGATLTTGEGDQAWERGTTDADGRLLLYGGRDPSELARFTRDGEALYACSWESDGQSATTAKLCCRAEPEPPPDLPQALCPPRPFWGSPGSAREKIERAEGRWWRTALEVRGEGDASFTAEPLQVRRVQVLDPDEVPIPGIGLVLQGPTSGDRLELRADGLGHLEVPVIEGWSARLAGWPVEVARLEERLVMLDWSEPEAGRRHLLGALAGREAAMDLLPSASFPSQRLDFEPAHRALLKVHAEVGAPYAPQAPLAADAFVERAWADRPLPLLRVFADGQWLAVQVPAWAGQTPSPPPPGGEILAGKAGPWAPMGKRSPLRPLSYEELLALDPIFLDERTAATPQEGGTAWRR